MDNRDRQTIPEGRVQGPREQITYRVKTTRWGGSPTDTALEVIAGDADVTATVSASANPPVDGDDILVNIGSLNAGLFYTVNVHFTSDGQKLSTFFYLACA